MMKRGLLFWTSAIFALSISTGHDSAAQAPPTKGLTREVWENLGGGDGIYRLKNNPAFFTGADEIDRIPTAKSARDGEDDFGVRLRGYIVAPKTGLYTFWIRGGSRAEFYLSRDRRPERKVKLSWRSTGADDGERRVDWSQRSVPMLLEKGQSYYVEILQRGRDNADEVELAWSYFAGDMKNWAREKVAKATQSSVAEKAYAYRAKDGKRGRYERGDPATMTRNRNGSWWSIDLGQTRAISEIDIFNLWGDRIEHFEGLSNFRVTIADEAGNEVAHKDYFTTRGWVRRNLSWRFFEPVQGRYVTIQLLGKNRAGNQILSLAEVEVWGCDSETVLHRGAHVIPERNLRAFVKDPADLDDDGLRDFWEKKYGFDPAVPQSGEHGTLADPDGDGLSNFRESRHCRLRDREDHC